MLTKNGPRIIEMTCRLSGGFDSQYLVPAATGKNVLKVAILIALGKPFPKNLLIDKKQKVGVTGSIWPKPGKILNIKGKSKSSWLLYGHHLIDGIFEIISAFLPIRSSRLMPGCLGNPEVTTTTSEPAISS